MEDTEEYLDRLRAVFELFDTEKRGFITVDHFVDLARDHFQVGAEESRVYASYSIFNVNKFNAFNQIITFYESDDGPSNEFLTSN